MSIASKILTGKSTVQGKPTVKAGPSQTAKIVNTRKGK
jgi:hypothetical protein